MIHTVNKLVLFTLLLVMLFIFSMLPKAQGLGFELVGKMEFHGYYNGTGSWGIGKAVTLVPKDTLIYKNLVELEGKKVRIIIEVVK